MYIDDTVALGKALIDRAMFKLVSGDIDAAAEKHQELCLILQDVYDKYFVGKRSIEELAIFIGMFISHLGFVVEKENKCQLKPKSGGTTKLKPTL